MNKPIAACPSCGGKMIVRELECCSCDIQVRGHFDESNKFSALNPQQWEFLNSFLSNRGVIRDIEADLGISYPTVRSRLDSLLATLGYGDTPAATEETSAPKLTKRIEILSALDRGEIDADTAATLLAKSK
ncbi:MAG TPA: DUF2089 domain-containing protein [Capsulimonadaceae bacterium]